MALYIGRKKVTPTLINKGTVKITSNGTVGVAGYAQAEVDVPAGIQTTVIPAGKVTPVLGSIEVTVQKQ